MKRLISLIVSLALLTVVLTGCTGGPADSRVATAPEAAGKMAWPRTSEGIAAMNPDYIFFFGAIESKRKI